MQHHHFDPYSQQSRWLNTGGRDRLDWRGRSGRRLTQADTLPCTKQADALRYTKLRTGEGCYAVQYRHRIVELVLAAIIGLVTAEPAGIIHLLRGGQAKPRGGQATPRCMMLYARCCVEARLRQDRRAGYEMGRGTKNYQNYHSDNSCYFQVLSLIACHRTGNGGVR